jgi:hypothetical protein
MRAPRPTVSPARRRTRRDGAAGTGSADGRDHSQYRFRRGRREPRLPPRTPVLALATMAPLDLSRRSLFQEPSHHGSTPSSATNS